MAVNPDRAAEVGQTPVYTYRMLMNFGPGRDYLKDAARFRGPITVLVGTDDEIFRADRFAPVLEPAHPHLKVSVLPGIDHMGMTVQPAALAALAEAAA